MKFQELWDATRCVAEPMAKGFMLGLALVGAVGILSVFVRWLNSL